MDLSVVDVGGEIATSQVLVNYCASVSEQLEKTNALIFINLDSEFIINNDALPVPPESVILELSGKSVVTEELLSHMGAWQSRGFQFAIDGYDFSASHEQLLPYAGYIKVDVLSHSASQLRERMDQRGSPEGENTVWVAERIEDEYVLEACKGMGFDWFQGYFLAKPKEVMGNSIRPGTAVTVQIIKELDQPGISMDDISRLVAQDPKLTVQMLKIINSSLFSLPRPVNDLKSALVFLGIDMLRQWAMILAFLSNGSVHLEACRLALLRAKTAERFMSLESQDDDLPSVAFLSGLVSGVDILLNIEPKTFLSQVELADEIQDAVLERTGPVGKVLAEVLNLEYAVAQHHEGLSETDLSLLDAREEASNWVHEVMQVLKS